MSPLGKVIGKRSITAWMSCNLLLPNSVRTGLILFGPKNLREISSGQKATLLCIDICMYFFPRFILVCLESAT